MSVSELLLGHQRVQGGGSCSEGCVYPQVLEDVTGQEFVLLMRVVSALRLLQTVSGRQQLVELVVEQAFLEQALNPADPDTVDRLLQCTRQALPLFSVSAASCWGFGTALRSLCHRQMIGCVFLLAEKCPFYSFYNLLL